MIYHSTAILDRFSCPTYWMRSCLTPEISNSKRPFHITKCPTVHDPHHKVGKGACDLTLCANISQHWIGMWSCINIFVQHHLAQVSLIAQPMLPSLVSITFSTDQVKHYSFFLVKACLENFCDIQNLEGLYCSSKLQAL